MNDQNTGQSECKEVFVVLQIIERCGRCYSPPCSSCQKRTPKFQLPPVSNSTRRRTVSAPNSAVRRTFDCRRSTLKVDGDHDAHWRCPGSPVVYGVETFMLFEYRQRSRQCAGASNARSYHD
ncbi:hypothetical protein PISMIDRAFT_571234 [Pisolithus microcarpus 441]|uniref:Uncharacterized protein n=1 Tax=Pisolithus microcarpus 441 TaxID=765257 RepID=A0A0C9ZM06_9AGAM|nr:hypothetical protein PISMIDRAFT_571234 [Pisolithus microcarpus 441]